jgi:hypothetical protein
MTTTKPDASAPSADRPNQLASSASPRPTYAPAMMALGVAMTFWGVTTMWIVSAVGAGLMACSLWIWIDEIRKSS